MDIFLVVCVYQTCESICVRMFVYVCVVKIIMWLCNDVGVYCFRLKTLRKTGKSIDPSVQDMTQC